MTTQQQRRDALETWRAETYQADHPDWSTMFENLDTADLPRFLLVETSTIDCGLYLTGHDDPQSAESECDAQEYPEDWTGRLYDLDSPDAYGIPEEWPATQERRTTFAPPGQAPHVDPAEADRTALDAIADLLRRDDAMASLVDIGELVRATGRDTDPPAEDDDDTAELPGREGDRALAFGILADVPRCLDCGELVTTDDDPADDDADWYHHEDANDAGDHSAHYHTVAASGRCRDDRCKIIARAAGIEPDNRGPFGEVGPGFCPSCLAPAPCGTDHNEWTE